MSTRAPDSPPARPGRFVTLLLGVALFAGVIALGGDESIHKLGHLQPGWLVAAGIGVGLMLWLFSWRWRVIATALAGRAPGTPASFFFYSLTASATSLFMPQTANVLVVRTAMLNRLTGMPLAPAGASVLLDKLFDLLPVLLLTPPALALIFFDIPLRIMLAVITAEIIITALLVRRYHAWYPRVVMALVRLAVPIIRRVPVLKRLKAAARLEQIEAAPRLQGGPVQIACGLTLLGTLAMLGRSWLIARSVGLAISPPELVAGMALAQASLLLAITPGALGTLELGWYLGLSAAGVSDASITPFLIAHRVLQSAFVLVLYTLSYGWHLARSTKTP